MTGFDYVVLVIVGMSILLGVMRGLVQEILDLLGWIVAFLVAKAYAAQFAPMLPEYVSGEMPRLLVAFVALFLAVLVLTNLVRLLFSTGVKSLGLGIFNRILGAVFGLGRGLLIVGVFVLLAGLTALPQQKFWKKALFSASLEKMVISIKPWLPEDLARHINYN